jgi:hypothetical protein
LVFSCYMHVRSLRTGVGNTFAQSRRPVEMLSACFPCTDAQDKQRQHRTLCCQAALLLQVITFSDDIKARASARTSRSSP